VLWAVWAAFLVAAARPRAIQLARFAAALLAPAAFVAWWSRNVANAGNLAFVRAHPVHHSLATKLTVLTGAFTAGPRIVELTLLALFVAALALACAGEREPDARRRLTRFGGLAALMLAGFFALPQDLGGLSFAYERLLPFALLFAALCAARNIRFTVIYQSLAIALVVVQAAFQWVLFHEYDAELRALRGCLAQARPGSSLAGLLGMKQPETTALPLFLHTDNLHTYWNLGPVFAHSMALLPTTPVYWKRDPFHNPPPPVFDWSPQALDWQRNGQYLDYFLIRDRWFSTKEPFTPDAWYLKEGYPQCRLVCVAGPWRLWENRRPTPP
jgi:hypothetical protein